MFEQNFIQENQFIWFIVMKSNTIYGWVYQTILLPEKITKHQTAKGKEKGRSQWEREKKKNENWFLCCTSCDSCCFLYNDNFHSPSTILFSSFLSRTLDRYVYTSCKLVSAFLINSLLNVVFRQKHDLLNQKISNSCISVYISIEAGRSFMWCTTLTRSLARILLLPPSLPPLCIFSLQSTTCCEFFFHPALIYMKS